MVSMQLHIRNCLERISIAAGSFGHAIIEMLLVIFFFPYRPPPTPLRLQGRLPRAWKMLPSFVKLLTS